MVVLAVSVAVVLLVSAACVVSKKPPMMAAKATIVSKAKAVIFLFMLVHLPFFRCQLVQLIIKRFFRIIPNYVHNLFILLPDLARGKFGNTFIT